LECQILFGLLNQVLSTKLTSIVITTIIKIYGKIKDVEGA
jgi:hypothetical protein